MDKNNIFLECKYINVPIAQSTIGVMSVKNWSITVEFEENNRL